MPFSDDMQRTIVCHAVRINVDGIVHICPSEDEILQGCDVGRLVVENPLVGKRDHFNGALLGSDLGKVLEHPEARLVRPNINMCLLGNGNVLTGHHLTTER